MLYILVFNCNGLEMKSQFEKQLLRLPFTHLPQLNVSTLCQQRAPPPHSMWFYQWLPGKLLCSSAGVTSGGQHVWTVIRFTPVGGGLTFQQLFLETEIVSTQDNVVQFDIQHLEKKFHVSHIKCKSTFTQVLH